MNKIITIAIVMVCAIIGSLFVVRFLSREDTWICVQNQWVKHGNPSALQPETGCGNNPATTKINFDETGHFVKDNPGLKPGVWHLIYEKPGSPALTAELRFDDKSVCAFNGKQGACPDVLLPSSAQTEVKGIEQNGIVEVVSAISGNPPIACTMEAKLCPDGSYVGRTGPNCEFAQCPAAKNPAESSVSGSVTISPVCPVERIPPEPQCAPKPYETEIKILSASDNTLIKTVKNQTDGSFSAVIPYGNYIFQATGGNPYPRCTPITLSVQSPAVNQINLSCDTGIR